MSNRVLMVSTEYLKSRSPLFENVNDKTLREAIYESQRMYIEPILGSALYNDLIKQIEGSKLKPDYEILLEDYIQQALKFYAIQEASPFIANAYTPTGVKKLTQDSSVEISQVELKALRTRWASRAHFWAKKVILYLKSESNLGKFPEYQKSKDRLDTVIPIGTSYKTALYLGGGNSGACSWEYCEYEKKSSCC